MTNCLQNSPPLTELPTVSSGGDQRQIPITFGTTSKMQPLIPDFAGSPTFPHKKLFSFSYQHTTDILVIDITHRYYNILTLRRKQIFLNCYAFRIHTSVFVHSVLFWAVAPKMIEYFLKR